MAKKNKKAKSTLSPAQRQKGKNNVYIILGMIIIGLGIAGYRLVLA